MNQNKQTERDQLTGFRTAEAVEKAFDKYLQEAADKEESLSVAIIDLDNFRNFNEKHGYGYGNGILKRVAKIILQHIPKSAITGRLSDLFSTLRLSCDKATTGQSNSLAIDFNPRLISDISCVRFSLLSPFISWR